MYDHCGPSPPSNRQIAAIKWHGAARWYADLRHEEQEQCADVVHRLAVPDLMNQDQSTATVTEAVGPFCFHAGTAKALWMRRGSMV